MLYPSPYIYIGKFETLTQVPSKIKLLILLIVLYGRVMYI